MIILDTNIISEMMKPIPSARVISWLDQQNVTQLFITTISIAEISYGLHVLPKGSRHSYLEDAFNKAINESFSHRIVPFDDSAAHFYGVIMSERKKSGRPMSILDGQIAAIARAHEAAIATRNIRDFEHCKLELINPFEFLDESALKKVKKGLEDSTRGRVKSRGRFARYVNDDEK